MSAALELTSEQGRAVELATRDYPPVMVITGGPGTGKSTILRTVLEDLARQGLRVLLMAPSGKAAVRMREAAGHPAYTIHSALGLFNGGAFARAKSSSRTWWSSTKRGCATAASWPRCSSRPRTCAR